jgi:RNA polymerase sigma-70 factor, ECF subfamily
MSKIQRTAVSGYEGAREVTATRPREATALAPREATELDPSDERLVERLGARDQGALGHVMERHGPAVLGLARRVVADLAAAEEVAQDTFLALWQRPGAFDPAKGSLRGFLLGVARKKAIDAVRKEAVRTRARGALEQRGIPGAPSIDVEERETVLTALGELTKLQREAIFLAYFGGLTYREVAGELGVPLGTAKTRMRDGLLRLRSLLEGPLTA